MDEKISTTKRRILELVKNKGFKVSKFFGEIGESYENYKGRSLDSSPSIDILEKIRTKIPDVNIEWILTGEGEMFIPEATKVVAQSSNNEILLEIIREERLRNDNLIREKDKRIEELILENQGLLHKNEMLQLQIDSLKKDCGNTNRYQKNVG